MNWFKKLAKRAKLVLVLSLIVGLAGLSGIAYWIYKRQVSAETTTSPVRVNLNIAGAKVANDRIVESTALSSFGIYNSSGNVREGYTTVRGINSSFSISISKVCESCFFRLQTSQLVSQTTGANFNSKSGNTKVTPGDVYNIFANADGSMSVSLISSGQGATTTATVSSAGSQTKCIELGGEYVLLTKSGDFWNGTQKNGNKVQIHDSQIGGYIPDPTKCTSQASSTASATGSEVSTETKCVDQGGEYVLFTKNGDFWYGTQSNGNRITRHDSEMQGYISDPSKCASQAAETATTAQPAVGAASLPENILDVPLMGGGSSFPTGNNSVTFRAVRYSVAEEDPVQITLSGQGKQNFTHYTAVGGASFEITLLTAATAAKSTSFGAPIAYAAVDTNGDQNPAGTDQQGLQTSGEGAGTTGNLTQTSGETAGSGPINTSVVTKTECEKDTISEDVLKQLRRLKNIRSYRISGIIPDNGTKSALTIINLPDASYKVSVKKDGFSSCSGYFHLEGGAKSNIGGIPLLVKSSSVEPPSIEGATLKIPGKDANLGDVYLAQKGGGGQYLYSSKCTQLGWVPEGEIGAMINTPLCQRTPQISQSGETIFTDENGNPLSGPGAEAVLANILNRCGGVNLNIFGGGSGSDRMSALEATLLGAAGGAFGAQMSKGEIVTKDVVYPAGFALIAALTGNDINIGVGNNCVGQSLPSSYYSSSCSRCLSDPRLLYSDPNCSRCYQQSWQNQIPWDVLRQAQSLTNF